LKSKSSIDQLSSSINSPVKKKPKIDLIVLSDVSSPDLLGTPLPEERESKLTTTPTIPDAEEHEDDAGEDSKEL